MARSVLARDDDWVAPGHAPVEVLRALRRYEQAGHLDAVQAESVIEVGVRYAGPAPELLAFAWGARARLSPYDAPYVHLAEVFGAPLVTADLRLASAAEALGGRRSA